METQCKFATSSSDRYSKKWVWVSGPDDVFDPDGAERRIFVDVAALATGMTESDPNPL